MTAKQTAARKKFKLAVAEAKKLRKKNPKLSQAQAVKQAFAILYKTKAIPGGKKVGAVKKKAAKKAAPKKKAAKKSVVRNYGSHKDTASHNVNIKVMSGIGKMDKELIKRLDLIQNEIEKTETAIWNFNHWKKELIKEKGKAFFNNAMKNAKGMLSEYKKHKAELKKLI